MTDWNDWLSDYMGRYRDAFDEGRFEQLIAFRELAERVRDTGAKMIFAGNGASASISSHAAVDFTKQAKVRSMDFNEPNLITAFSNDYGYENWVSRALDAYADDGDVVVLTSVSGTSPNVVNAARRARERGLTVVTLTGKAEDNPLKAEGDLSLWYPSGAYNVVECVHMIWLTTVIDMVVGRAEYSVN